MAGGAGNDLIVTTCYPNCIDGGDVVDSGPGADEIRTGDGADEITGGPGPDEIDVDNCGSYTCPEPDVIDVDDGERDDVYCGGGGDVVRADPVEVGKVRKPRGAAASRLVVRKQSRRAGSTVPRATNVDLTLARALARA